MTGADIASWIKDAGGWIGLVGGLAGLYTFAAGQWRRRLKVSVDYSTGNDAHNSWHQFTITNRSDLPLTFRYVGPAWFLSTPLLPHLLSYATDMEDHNPSLTVLAPRASVSWPIDDEYWQKAYPPERRPSAYLKVGIEVPMTGTVKWVRPRKRRN